LVTILTRPVPPDSVTVPVVPPVVSEMLAPVTTTFTTAMGAGPEWVMVMGVQYPVASYGFSTIGFGKNVKAPSQRPLAAAGAAVAIVKTGTDQAAPFKIVRRDVSFDRCSCERYVFSGVSVMAPPFAASLAKFYSAM